MEEWKPIPKSRGQYEASTCGRIRNARTGRILATQVSKTGTMVIGLNGFMSGRNYTVAQLVGMAFYPEARGRVQHRNGNRYDNRPENLIFSEDYYVE